MTKTAIPFAVFLILYSFTPVVSQDAIEGESASSLLGKGMHQFFEGEYQKVIQSLDASIGLNQRDPRAYYFRGLTKLRLNQLDAATQDFRTGAFWEAYQKSVYTKLVSRALERIQGKSRSRIEQLRLEQREELTLKRELLRPVRPVGYGEVKTELDVNKWIHNHRRNHRFPPPQPDGE